MIRTQGQPPLAGGEAQPVVAAGSAEARAQRQHGVRLLERGREHDAPAQAQRRHRARQRVAVDAVREEAQRRGGLHGGAGLRKRRRGRRIHLLRLNNRRLGAGRRVLRR